LHLHLDRRPHIQMVDSPQPAVLRSFCLIGR
jgi:hypothetical protein